MKILKLMGASLIMLCCMSIISCKKAPVALSIDLTMEVTKVKAINAMLEIKATGDTPSLVRYMGPTPEAEVLDAVGSLDNESAVKSFISKNGIAIKLPYSIALMNLEPEQKYVVGVVVYDSHMNAFGYATQVFTTLDLESMTDNALGDSSNVGNMTENIL